MTERDLKPNLLVICGATATGKTRAAICAAQKLGGEIISADSMQIYKGLRIGTAQPTDDELAAVPHHLVAFLEPEQKYSAADYVRDAHGAIVDISSRGKLPIVCGGTGLYISSLIKGIRFAEQPDAAAVRERLAAEYTESGIEPMYLRLCELDPDYAAKIHPNNVKRVLRALELCECGITPSGQEAASRPDSPPYNATVIWLDYSDRSALYAAIERRVDSMLQNGLLDEAKYVYANRSTFITAAQAIGYKELFPYFENKSTLSECVSELKTRTRNYAKRQLSWFRALGADRHLFVDSPDYNPELLNLYD